MKYTGKNLITILIIGAVATNLLPFGGDSDAYAARKKKKRKMTGELKDLVYTDNVYGFSVSLLEDWSIKVSEKGEPIRVVAQKENYAVPPAFREAELYTTIPKFKVLIDTTSLELLDFLDSLRSPTFESKQKQNLMLELKVLNGQFTRPRVSRLRLENGIKGRLFKTSLDYSFVVQKPGESTGAPVQDQIKGDIGFFKKDNTLYILSCVCESKFYDINKPLFDSMIQSFAYVEGGD